MIQRVVALRPINHVLHATLSVCTGGLWLPVWAGIVIWRQMQR